MLVENVSIKNKVVKLQCLVVRARGGLKLGISEDEVYLKNFQVGEYLYFEV